ncbi:CLUMA_CG001990, isoform A [Clunio marinus]|uniref:CLUMA_CG001990, isoform A n=1 Tax=Clunio marinus TaxID=568069 RepID=A0A1J1HPS0_9DIPT|nr:CLUMA_CG001990, isoform A [Clunio marinus]
MKNFNLLENNSDYVDASSEFMKTFCKEFANAENETNLTHNSLNFFENNVEQHNDIQWITELVDLLDIFWEVTILFIIVSCIVFKDIWQIAGLKKLHSELKMKGNQLIETNRKMIEIYTNFQLHEYQIDDLKVIPRIYLKFLKSLITKYPFLHKIDEIFVNMQTGELFFNINEVQTKTLTKNNGKAKRSCHINSEAFDYLKNFNFH